MPRNLLLVLGDQLDEASAAFDGFDPAVDAVWMAEVAEESEHVWTHKARIAVFLSAMRHFRERLRERGISVDYRELRPSKAAREPASLAEALTASIKAFGKAGQQPERLIVVEPGEWRVRESLRDAADRLGLPLEIRSDRHFFSTPAAFAEHAAGRKQLRLEYFYRPLRKQFDVLMERGEPAGGAWNFDAANRGAFPKSGPGTLPQPVSFPPDAVTREVLALVESRFAEHPGRLERFYWPVTPEDAKTALTDFITHRLPSFGTYQDAIWTGEPWLYHARLSAAMNLKLLNPRDVVTAAEEAWRDGAAGIESTEGFIRQVLGWREYVRGVYWQFMPEYEKRNHLGSRD